MLLAFMYMYFFQQTNESEVIETVEHLAPLYVPVSNIDPQVNNIFKKNVLCMVANFKFFIIFKNF